jgi:hypothetical protein
LADGLRFVRGGGAAESGLSGARVSEPQRSCDLYLKRERRARRRATLLRRGFLSLDDHPQTELGAGPELQGWFHMRLRESREGFTRQWMQFGPLRHCAPEDHLRSSSD